MAKIKTETRTLANGAPGKSLFLLYDPKKRTQLGAESQPEYDGLVELMFDRDIVSLTVQPVKFRIPHADGEFDYTPDVQYIRFDGRIGYREFKGDYEKLSAIKKQRYVAAGNHIRSLGFEFSLVDAQSLRKGYRLANIKLLLRYAACELDTSVLSWLNKRLGLTPDAYNIGTFRTQAGTAKIPSLFKLLWEQRVAVDIDGEPLTDESRLWRALP